MNVQAECIGGPLEGRMIGVDSRTKTLHVPVPRKPAIVMKLEEYVSSLDKPTFDQHDYVLLIVPGLQPLLVYAGFRQ